MQDMVNQVMGTIGAYIPNLIGALLILIVGWLLALIVSSAARGVLRRTSLSTKLDSWVSEGKDSKAPDIARGIGSSLILADHDPGAHCFPPGIGPYAGYRSTQPAREPSVSVSSPTVWCGYSVADCLDYSQCVTLDYYTGYGSCQPG